MKNVPLFTLLVIFLLSFTVQAAYHHGTDTDSDIVLQAYPDIAGTKLDSCALCHSGGEYEKKPGVFITLGSCQWCHYSYGYDAAGDIGDTLNSYGEDYLREGQNLPALETIASHDSDGDGYSNSEEIVAGRYPGDEEDDPTKVPAPYKIYSLEELKGMELHNQLMLMNTHKSGDFYAEYAGVAVSDLLDSTGILDYAEGIVVFAPDGWSQYHPLETDNDPLLYHVYGEYPEALFYYDPQAEDNDIGWCDYSSPAVSGLQHGDVININGGLQMVLAYLRDGEYLQKGELDDSNRLQGEGPFRLVPPQKIVGPPDQSVKSDNQDVIWPFDENADHNAGFATRSATIIKIEPLPEGTTDIDIFEAGWDYVDKGNLVLYGAINPFETIMTKLHALRTDLQDTDRKIFKHRILKRIFKHRLRAVKRFIKRGKNELADVLLEHLSWKVDGCIDSDKPDENDWVVECEKQSSLYWSLHELRILAAIE